MVSVIVVNWNGMEYLSECLESVRSQTYRPRELLIVDNASTDGSREWLRGYASSEDTLLELERNRGFSGGVNAGMRASNGEFIALLNNDAVADPRWLANMVEPMLCHQVGMVASKILFYDRPNVIDKAGHLLYPDGLNRGRGAGELDRGQFDGEDEIFFPDGCAALYRTRMLEEVGPFDEQFFAYGDDAELGIRARWRGWECRYAPGAVVFHRHSSSLGKYSPVKAFLVERNRIWVAAKLFPWPVLLMTPAYTMWRFYWHAWSVLASHGLAGRVSRDHGSFSLLAALVRAYVSGVMGLPAILRKRREIFRKRKLTSGEFYSLMRRYRIPARELAMKD